MGILIVELGLSQITDTKNLNLSGDYAIDTFTVSRNNEDVSINYFSHQLLKFVLQLNLGSLIT